MEYFLVRIDYCTGGEKWLMAAREIPEAKKWNCWKLEIEPVSLKIGQEIEGVSSVLYCLNEPCTLNKMEEGRFIL